MDLAIYPHFFWIANPKDGYDCSNKTYEQWEATGEVKPLLGAYFFIVGVLALICYILVILSMSDSEILRQPCFKIMYFNCFIDCGNLITNSVVTGLLFYYGAVFCTWPLTSFALGGMGYACWCSSCFNCIAIGINRCCTMFNTLTGMFTGKRVYLWLVTSFSLLIFALNFTRTPMFNSKMGAWFYYPFISEFEVEMKTIKNVIHPVLNVVTAFSITLLYALLCGFMAFSKEATSYNSNQRSRAQYMVFVQSVIICCSTCIAAYLYVYMQFFATPSWLILTASIAYQMCSAIPCIVYLTLNSSVRGRARKILRGQLNSTRITLATFSMRRPSRVSSLSQRSK